MMPPRGLLHSIIAGLLFTISLGYGAVLITTYFQTAAPSEPAPSLAELDRLLFSASRPINPLERRLALSNSPLGTGPLIIGEGVTPSEELPTNEIAEREGERQALLAWIRTGASRMAYERDDYAFSLAVYPNPITPELLHTEANVDSSASRHVRIRTLIQNRCLNCHNEEGDDTARLIPFDTYEAIARYLVPETHGDAGRVWVLFSLTALFPFAGISALAFAFTNQTRNTRIAASALSVGALGVVIGSLWYGAGSTPVLLTAAGVAVAVGSLQISASVLEWTGFLSTTHRPASQLSHTTTTWPAGGIRIER